MASRQALREVIAAGGSRRFASVVALSLLAAVTEGAGFVLLVPLLAALGGAEMPLGLALPRWPIEGLLGVFVILVAVRAGVEVLRRLAVQDLRIAVVDGLRLRAVDAVLGAGWRWSSGLAEGEAEALLISDIERCSYAVELCGTLVRLVASLCALGLAALVISPLAAIAGIGLGALALVLLSPMRRRARKLGELLSARYEELHARLGEGLRGLRVIKSFGREKTQSRRIAGALGDLRAVERGYVLSGAMAHAILQLFGALLAALGVWAALQVFAMPLAVVLALAALFVRALPQVGELQASAQGWAHAAPALDRALAMTERGLQHAEALGAEQAPKLGRVLALQGVGYAHREGHSALEHIDLKIAAGTMVALCGPSGAGKSTLADLCAGLTGPDAGAIAVDGVALTEANRVAWRRRVAYVQQEPVLFSGSVKDNLLLVEPEADEAQMIQALEAAHAGFVHSLPGGLDCDLGNAGRALSGGEKQRIALARALMRKPDLIILDEATSALDADSEEAIAAALRGLAGQTTVIAIAHRGLLRDMADRIVTLENGRLTIG